MAEHDLGLRCKAPPPVPPPRRPVPPAPSSRSRSPVLRRAHRPPQSRPPLRRKLRPSAEDHAAAQRPAGRVAAQRPAGRPATPAIEPSQEDLDAAEKLVTLSGLREKAYCADCAISGRGLCCALQVDEEARDEEAAADWDAPDWSPDSPDSDTGDTDQAMAAMADGAVKLNGGVVVPPWPRLRGRVSHPDRKVSQVSAEQVAHAVAQVLALRRHGLARAAEHAQASPAQASTAQASPAQPRARLVSVLPMQFLHEALGHLRQDFENSEVGTEWAQQDQNFKKPQTGRCYTKDELARRRHPTPGSPCQCQH